MPKRCKSHDKSLKFMRLTRDIKEAAFLTWSAEQFLSWQILKKILTSNGATSFLDWICPKYTKSYKKSLKTRKP